MNINEIKEQNTGFLSNRQGMFASHSMLEIGSKGDTVTGEISGVSDKVSINFNGIEVAVSKSAVQGASLGETRKFTIMDVSKDNIVLKEAGESSLSREAKAMVCTRNDNQNYSFAECFKANEKTAQAEAEAGKNLSILTGEDYKQLEEEGGPLEAYQEDCLERAIGRIKEERAWKRQQLEAGSEKLQEQVEMAEEMAREGFTTQKSMQQLRDVLLAADLPATDTNIMRIVSALDMSQITRSMSNESMVYMVQQQLPPTIENIYHSQFSGSEGVLEMAVSEETWQELFPQIQGVMEKGGYTTSQDQQNARWLLANDLPVTEESLEQVRLLQDIGENMTPAKVLNQIILTMENGGNPEQA